MPTDDKSTLQDQTATPLDPSSISDDTIVSHPKYKELEEKHAAARKGMDSSNLTKKQLEAELARLRVLAGEEQKVEEKKTEPSYVTPAQLEAKAWEIANAKDIETYGDDEYKSDVQSGIPAAKALQYAKLRFSTNPEKAKIVRQQSLPSGGTSGVRDLENIDITDKDRENQKIWGYSDKAILKQKELKKSRGF